MALKSPAVVQQ